MQIIALQSPRERPAADAELFGDLIECGIAEVEFGSGLFELRFAELSGASKLFASGSCSREAFLRALNEYVPLEFGEGTEKHEHEFSWWCACIDMEVCDVQVDPPLVQGIELSDGIGDRTIGTIKRIDDEGISRLKGSDHLLIDWSSAGNSGNSFDEKFIGKAFQAHDLAIMALFGRGNAQIGKPLHEPLKNNEFQVVTGLIIDPFCGNRAL